MTDLHRVSGVGTSLIATLNSMMEENIITSDVAVEILSRFDTVFAEELERVLKSNPHNTQHLMQVIRVVIFRDVYHRPT